MREAEKAAEMGLAAAGNSRRRTETRRRRRTSISSEAM